MFVSLAGQCCRQRTSLRHWQPSTHASRLNRKSRGNVWRAELRVWRRRMPISAFSWTTRNGKYQPPAALTLRLIGGCLYGGLVYRWVLQWSHSTLSFVITAMGDCFRVSTVLLSVSQPATWANSAFCFSGIEMSTGKRSVMWCCVAGSKGRHAACTCGWQVRLCDRWLLNATS